MSTEGVPAIGDGAGPRRRCPGCGLVTPDRGLPDPDGRAATGECLDEYGELLPRIYGSAGGRHPLYQLVIDGYAVQHPDRTTPRGLRSLALSLMTLQLVLERGTDPAQGSRMHQMMMRGRPRFAGPLAHRELDSLSTHRDVRMREDWEQAVWEWVRQLWDAWSPAHRTVRGWNDSVLGP